MERSMRWRAVAVVIGVAGLGGVGLSGPGWAQGVTQGRSGLGTGDHPGSPANSLPAGSENATTGPQAKPAYRSGSSTANPGAAFERTRPVPATGALRRAPGAVSTTTFGLRGSTTRSGGAAGVTEGAGVTPPR